MNTIEKIDYINAYSSAAFTLTKCIGHYSFTGWLSILDAEEKAKNLMKEAREILVKNYVEKNYPEGSVPMSAAVPTGNYSPAWSKVLIHKGNE